MTTFEQRLVTLGRMPGACWTTVAGLMLLVSTPLAGPVLFVVGTPSETLFKNLVYALVGALVVIPGVFADTRRGFGRLMSARLPRHLGHISYGIFCLHLSLISLVLWSTDYRLFGGDGLQVWALTLAATLVAAELLYWLVEWPALRLYAARRRSSRSDPADHQGPRERHQQVRPGQLPGPAGAGAPRTEDVRRRGDEERYADPPRAGLGSPPVQSQ